MGVVREFLMSWYTPPYIPDLQIGPLFLKLLYNTINLRVSIFCLI